MPTRSQAGPGMIEHRLVNYFREEFAGLRMLGSDDPVLHHLLKLVGGHTRVNDQPLGSSARFRIVMSSDENDASTPPTAASRSASSRPVMQLSWMSSTRQLK